MSLRDRLRADVRAVLERDPSASSAAEVVLTSPGLWARWSHRLAGRLWARDRRLLAGVVATLTRVVTGIELHPAATVGERVVIDHGQGTVIGETATVGDDVLLYHGVTLGAKGVVEGERHPTVGDDVTLGANATVLGDVVVGDGATVGAGAVVVDEVEPGATVVGVPARSVDDSSVDAQRSGDEEPSATDAEPVDEAPSLATAQSVDDGLADAREQSTDGRESERGPERASRAADGADAAAEDEGLELEDDPDAAGPVCEVGGAW